MVFQHIVPGTSNQQRRALWAKGMRAIAVDIAFVDVMEANFACNRARPV
jgi:hypothetical protein